MLNDQIILEYRGHEGELVLVSDDTLYSHLTSLRQVIQQALTATGEYANDGSDGYFQFLIGAVERGSLRFGLRPSLTKGAEPLPMDVLLTRGANIAAVLTAAFAGIVWSGETLGYFESEKPGITINQTINQSVEVIDLGERLRRDQAYVQSMDSFASVVNNDPKHRVYLGMPDSPLMLVKGTATLPADFLGRTATPIGGEYLGDQEGTLTLNNQSYSATVAGRQTTLHAGSFHLENKNHANSEPAFWVLVEWAAAPDSTESATGSYVRGELQPIATAEVQFDHLPRELANVQGLLRVKQRRQWTD